MLPEDLKEAFDRHYRLGVLDIIEKVYRQPLTQPLSGYISMFLGDHRTHPMSRSFWPKRSMNFLSAT
jgi:hypothetical protein